MPSGKRSSPSNGVNPDMIDVDWGQVLTLAITFTGGFALAFSIRLKFTLRDIAGFWEWLERRRKDRKYREEQAKLQALCTHNFIDAGVLPIACTKCDLNQHDYEREMQLKEAGIRK